MQERRTFRPLRANLDRLLETFALVEGLPARRADDPELREAAREARVAVARVLMVLNRMESSGAAGERPGSEAHGEPAR